MVGSPPNYPFQRVAILQLFPADSSALKLFYGQADFDGISFLPKYIQKVVKNLF
jgi:hypothetical protein